MEVIQAQIVTATMFVAVSASQIAPASVAVRASQMATAFVAVRASQVAPTSVAVWASQFALPLQTLFLADSPYVFFQPVCYKPWLVWKGCLGRDQCHSYAVALMTNPSALVCPAVSRSFFDEGTMQVNTQLAVVMSKFAWERDALWKAQLYELLESTLWMQCLVGVKVLVMLALVEAIPLLALLYVQLETLSLEAMQLVVTQLSALQALGGMRVLAVMLVLVEMHLVRM